MEWVNNLGSHSVKESHEVTSLAESVSCTGGLYFVPAFSGLFAPHWRPDARGTMCGLTAYTTKQHLARCGEVEKTKQTKVTTSKKWPKVGKVAKDLSMDTLYIVQCTIHWFSGSKNSKIFELLATVLIAKICIGTQFLGPC